MFHATLIIMSRKYFFGFWSGFRTYNLHSEGYRTRYDRKRDIRSSDLKENARFPFVPAGSQCEQIPDLYIFKLIFNK